MRRRLCLAVAVGLVGCQSEPYRDYADAMARIAEARASVQREQARALIELAHGGDTTAKTVAVIMLGIGAGNGGAGAQYVNPTPPQNEALQWAQVLLPTVATLGLGYWGYRLGQTQSDNAANVSIAGYTAMGSIAQSGFTAVGQFKPVPFDWASLKPNVTTITNTTNTLDNQGNGAAVIGNGSAAVDNSTRPIAVVPPVVTPGIATQLLGLSP